MEIMSFAAITTNCATVFLHTNLFTNLDESSAIFAMFTTEHILLCLKLYYHNAVPDLHPDQARQMEIEANWDAAERASDIMKSMDAFDTASEAYDMTDYVDSRVPVHFEASWERFERPLSETEKRDIQNGTKKSCSDSNFSVMLNINHHSPDEMQKRMQMKEDSGRGFWDIDASESTIGSHREQYNHDHNDQAHGARNPLYAGVVV